MVEIIPYTEDDEDSSNWIPLSAPNANRSTEGTAADSLGIRGSVSNTAVGNDASRSQTRMDPTVEKVDDEEDENSSKWHELSSHPVSTATTQTVQSSWEKQIISHLTSPDHASAAKEDDYLSEDDENIVWSRPNNLKDDDGEFRPSLNQNDTKTDSKPVPVDQRNQNQSHQHLRRSSSQTSPRQTNQSQADSTSSQIYRQAAKNKLQESLIYHPIRALPSCFLRNLYDELKHELSLGWAAYLETNGGPAIFAPITFFILVAILGVALIGSGVFGVGSFVVSSAIRVGISMCKFVTWSVWEMRNHLAWLSAVSSLVLGIVIYVVMAKFRNAKRSHDITTTEADAPWVPKISTLLSWMIALTSPSIYELVAILYSLYALSLPISNENGPNHESANKCDAFITATTISSEFAALVIALLVFLVTCCGVSVFAGYLETGTSDRADDAAAVKQVLHACIIVRIKRHLNECHTLSIVILAISVASFLFIRALHLYYGGSLLTVVSGIGTAGFHLLCIAFGALLLKWAVEQSVAELHITNTNDDSSEDGKSIFQRMIQNALKQSLIEITTNAVWSDISGLSGVLSENDGTLRLAILEWLIDRWVSSSSSETSQSTSTPTASKPGQEYSSSTTSPPIDVPLNSHSNNGSSFASENPTNSGTASDYVHTGIASNANVLNSLPSYESLQKVISKLDADNALLPAIQSYRAWVYSLPPSRNVAIMVALILMCPGMFALLLLVVWSALMRMKTLSWSFINSRLSEECGNALIPSGHHFVYATLVMLSPLLCLEYLRVRRWWTRVADNISGTESSDQTEEVPDSLFIMVGYDLDDMSNSVDGPRQKDSTLNNLILRTWKLLLESIAMLESSIPVVRCATVASAAISLSSDAACLFDLAIEIKNRGLLGGIGLLIVDAFNHHLSEEIRRRGQQNNDNSAPEDRDRSTTEDDIGGKYTSTAINAVNNATKLAHNISCLMDNDKNRSKDDSHQEKAPEAAQPKTENQGLIPKPENEATEHHSDKDENNNSFNTVANDSKDELVEGIPKNRHSDESVNGDEESCNDEHEESNLDARTKRTPGSVAADTDDAPSAAQAKGEGVQTATASNEAAKHDMPLWIGGGLALAGAVFGGLAVAANMKKDDNKKEECKISSDALSNSE